MNIEVRRPTKKELEEAESWPIWEKGESEFPWEYFEPETCLILEGEAVVETPDEDTEFGAGDYVVFPEGLKCTWKIKQKIRKHYKLG
jgi:uncharacterized cupin superfamily protein